MRTHLLATVTTVFALGLAAAAPAHADHADARPAPYRVPPDRVVDLRAENAMLRAELARYRSIVDQGLAQIEDTARASRDRRLVMRIRAMTADLRRQLDGDRGRGRRGHGWRDDGPGWRDDGPDWRDGGPGPGVVIGGPGVVIGPPGPIVVGQPPPVVEFGMPTAEYQQLLTAIGNARFPADQLAVIDAAAPYYQFTSDQVVGLMRAFAFDDSRIEVAVRLSARVIDPGRFYVAYDALQFSSSRDTLRQRLGR